ncbi:ribosome maturation factor RimM [Thalassobaculum sp. OXR-137]|uniref:ribosome maturation factor RimM n=1 Tax=Thalassobaculum sp. OXR-137 TaxID=3100173 RepID=UPI002AC9CBBE|nr:ribosome maturation factor RimM [Thalassobaculum sp. OXR-137]WPZ35701.1 ribosome maturation factor RimM [Thalassobaculum sp. OXR-137]
MSARVCLGAITGPHGVRGLVKVKPFTEVPADIAAYGPVEDETGTRRFTLQVTGEAKGQVIVALEGVGDRNAAEALKGQRLYVAREALPEPDDGSFYHADLIGMEVVGLDGTLLGRVSALYDFGAGDVLEFRGEDGKARMLPFTEQVVPTVDLTARRMVVDPPEGALDDGPDKSPREDRGDEE